MEERDDWLSKIESRHKYDDSAWIPSNTKTIYDQILDDAHKDRGRMASVIRELVELLQCEFQIQVTHEHPARAKLISKSMSLVKNLSPDAKELVK